MNFSQEPVISGLLTGGLLAKSLPRPWGVVRPNKPLQPTPLRGAAELARWAEVSLTEHPKLTAIFLFLTLSMASTVASYDAAPASSAEAPSLSRMVNDFSSSLRVAYVNDLDLRLRRFNEKTGYAIVVVIIPTGEDKQISELIRQLFIKNQLKRRSVDGTVLLLITAKEGWVIAEPSEKVEKKFLRPGAVETVTYFYDDEFKHWDAGVERRVQAVIRILDPWFYVFDPPSTDPALILEHFQTAEVILFPLVPFLGLMIGIALMAFTGIGHWPGYERFIVCGFFGCSAALASAFILRQPGGIAPAMVSYSAVLGFVVPGMVAALKPYWFYETVRGRKPGEKMHPPFFGKG